MRIATGARAFSSSSTNQGENIVTNRYFMLAATIAAASASPAFASAFAPRSAPKPAAAAPAAAQAPKSTTRAQFVASVQQRFNAMDTNHDGVVDANEVAAMQQRELQQARAVEQQRLTAEFNKLDTNKDGQLSKAEFMAAAPDLKPRVTPQQVIAQVDSNKDGKISFQEFEAGPLASFNNVDANHDGTVTPQEIQAARTAKKK
jgi:hypothetical protein